MFDLLRKYQFAGALEKLSEASDEGIRQAAALGNDVLISDPQFETRLRNVLKDNENFSLSQPLTEQGITLLHIAVITGAIIAVEVLLELGCLIDIKDCRQWTPLHHAALLGNAEMMDFLIAKGADQKAKTNNDGTFQDILQLTHRKPMEPHFAIPPIHMDLNGVESQLTAGDYLKLTGFHYIDDLFIDPEYYLQEWFHPSVSLVFFDFSKYYKNHRKSLLQHLPRCILSPLIAENSEKQSKGLGAMALYSGETFSVGQAIVEYCCHLSLRTDEKRIHFNNESVFIPEGFPNCSLISYENSSGAPLRGMIIALDSIEKGELLCRHYSEKRSKFRPYSLLRCEEMAEFVKEQDIQHLMDQMMLQMGNPLISIQDYVLLNKLCHIVETPAAIWWLILHEALNLDTACYLVAAGSLAGLITADEFIQYEVLLKTVKACLIVKALILNAEKDAAVEFLTILTDFMKKYPLEDALFRANDLCTMWRNMLKAYESPS